MKLFSKRYLRTAALVVAFALPLTGSAQAQESTIKLGMLSCAVEGGFGLLLGSTRDIACTFNPARGGKTEFYDGTINKLGVDVGITGESYIRWLVVAGQNHVHRRSGLEGRYSGASASASVFAGLGANVLVGGNSDQIALQPVSVQGQLGLNLAVGVARLRLKPSS